MYKKLKKLDSRLFFSLLAIFSGAILPLAFAPFSYYLFAELSLVLLLFVWLRATPGLSFWYGWLFGVAFFGCGVYWIYISIHHYGKAPVPLSIVILALFVAVLALYPACQGYLLSRFFPKNNRYKFLLAFPASFVLLESIRGWFLSGFPWLFLGYSHIDAPVRGFATVFGVYGLSFVVAVTSGAIFSIFFYWRKNIKFSFFLILFIILLWGSGFVLTKIDWTKQVGAEVPVSLIQGNIPQEEKWDPQNLWSILNRYAFLTAKNLDSKIIVWPEAAIPTDPDDLTLYLKGLSFVAKNSDTTILTGTPFYDKKNEAYYYNGILALGSGSGRYYKRHLVPFGEYLPLKPMLSWLHKFLIIPMSGFSSGAKNQPDLFAAKILVAPFICYEITYPGLVLDYLPQAGLLVTVSDDSWFGDSIAPYQHLEIARMRSLEVGRYQLFSTNTGPTAVINDRGQIIGKTPIFRETVLSVKVKNLVGRTPWVGFGQYIWLPLLLLGLGLAWRKRN